MKQAEVRTTELHFDNNPPSTSKQKIGQCEG